MLETLWDKDVSRCLCFDFGENTYICACSRAEAVNRFAAQCGNLCCKISRLFLKFDFYYDEDLMGDQPGKPLSINKLLLDHCHFDTVMISGLKFDCCDDFSLALFMFNGMARWPRTVSVWLHDSHISFWHNFPFWDPDEVDKAAPFALIEWDTWDCRVPVSTVVFQIDPNDTGKQRYISLQRGMDKRQLFWPFPPE